LVKEHRYWVYIMVSSSLSTMYIVLSELLTMMYTQ